MSLQFIFGGAGTGKTHKMYTDMIAESMNDNSVNYIVLVPEQFTMEAQKKMVSLHPNNGVMYIDILSFDRLALRVFEELGQGDINLIDDTAKNLIVRKALGEHRQELKIYAGKIGMSGFVDNMKSAISQLKQYGVDAAKLDEMIESTKGRAMLNGKLCDIKVTYEAFLDMIKDKFVTSEEALERLAAAATESELIRNSKIYIDGFTGFTPVQYKALESIIGCAKKVTVALTLPAEHVSFNHIKEHELFALSKTTVRKLGDIADRANIPIEKPVVISENEHSRLYGNAPIKHIEKNIFNYGRSERFSGENNAVSIHVCANPKEEAEYVAYTICDTVMNGGARYRDFAVITADMEGYYRYIDRAFKLYGIPNFIDHKRNIGGNPFINSIKSAIEVVEKNYSYESVFNFLRFGMTDLSADEVDRLENYVVRSGVRGRKIWENDFEILYNNMTEDELAAVNASRKKTADIFGEFYTAMKQRNATAGQYTLAVYDFIVQGNFYSKLCALENEFKEKGDVTAADEYAQAYEAVVKLLDKIMSLFGGEHISLKEYADILNSGLDSIKVGVIPPTIDRVVVGDMERTRLDGIKTLFFVGVNDGVIPKTGSRCDIITDRDKEILKDKQFELAPTVKENAFIERFYLYITLTKPSEKLFLSYSQETVSGGAMKKSYLIGEIANMFENIEITDESDMSDSEKKIVSYDTMLAVLAEAGRRYMESSDTEDWTVFYNMSRSDVECTLKADNIAAAMIYRHNEEKITKEAARKLYGNFENIGITRLEDYAKCAYMMFLKRGLRLKERKVHEIESVDIGNLYHNALDKFCHKVDAAGIDWSELEDGTREAFVRECVEQTVNEYENKAFLSSARSEYLTKRIGQMTQKTTWVLKKHLQAGRFKPRYYELNVSSGKVDRVDIYETDDREYVKVIDYKSGNTKFSLVDTYYGVQLQLVAYLKDVLDHEKNNHPDKEIIPAGVFYYNIKDPYIKKQDLKGKSAEESSDVQYGQFKMTGLVNSSDDIPVMFDSTLSKGGTSDIISVRSKDGVYTKSSNPLADTDKFNALADYADELKRGMKKRIADGNIEVNPIDGTKDPCTYCKFSGICGIDKNDLNGHRKLEKISDSEIWEKIMSDTTGENDGDKLD